STYGDFDSYGAAYYPTIIGALVSVFSFVDFIMELKMKKTYVFQSFNFSREIIAVCFVAIAILFYIFLADVLGFVITTSLILIFMAIPLVKKQKVFTALFLIVVATLIYLLFAKVLQVSLPVGLFFE
ncbi:tripartite tricarboxylate transporter TctB family protein, partial [Pasteurellaceae bacterium USgator41]